ncbi:LytTR family DNA-binding domain-containing protein [Larkinella knui]|uniref:DNA-binding response regulator n=1 Tax=Larkinella knui TaxID=2025310 RepID=A0A3P1CNJ7_9BACT|nr:LytTR family DNA-binding domain-containing protein [Larkinella knui]RRB14829.1 DNA-binding response regulator [Larkinella knui]
MKKVNCIIADDEVLSSDVLENYLSKLENYQVVATCKNGIEVFTALKAGTVDLLFLDIEMPQLTGLELVKSLKNSPSVIFTTAFRDYAVDGYELNAIDYLLKPISFDRFLRAIDKFETTALPSTSRSYLPAALPPGVPNPFIYVKSAKKTVKVFLKDIIFFEGIKESVKIKTVHGDIVTYQTLQDFEQRLPDAEFLRIHRSFIIAVDRIRAYSTTHVEVDDLDLPIGQSYQRFVRDALK